MGPFAPKAPKAQPRPKPKPQPKPRQTKPKEDRDKTAQIEDQKRRITGGGRQTTLGSFSDSLGE